jgi:Flp pilus assembly protein TadG
MNDRKNIKGQALVELAIVLSFFLLFMLVIFDLGRVVYFYSAIHNAAQEGARYGSTDPNATRIITASRRLTTGLAIDPMVTITDEKVTVQIDYQFNPITPVLKILTGSNSITLHATATMQLEP